MMVFAGNANPQLAHKIATRLHLSLGKAQVSRFSDGEVAVELMENVRGRDVFIVQSTCPPTNDNLMELLVMADALRRASRRAHHGGGAVFRLRSAGPAPTRCARADHGQASGQYDGVRRYASGLTVDLHADQIQGFFDIPVDNVYASPVLLGDVWKQKFET